MRNFMVGLVTKALDDIPKMQKELEHLRELKLICGDLSIYKDDPREVARVVEMIKEHIN